MSVEHSKREDNVDGIALRERTHSPTGNYMKCTSHPPVDIGHILIEDVQHPVVISRSLINEVSQRSVIIKSPSKEDSSHLPEIHQTSKEMTCMNITQPSTDDGNSTAERNITTMEAIIPSADVTECSDEVISPSLESLEVPVGIVNTSDEGGISSAQHNKQSMKVVIPATVGIKDSTKASDTTVSHLSTEDDDIFSKESGSIIADLAVVSTDVTECTSEAIVEAIIPPTDVTECSDEVISPSLESLEVPVGIVNTSDEGDISSAQHNKQSMKVVIPATVGIKDSTKSSDTTVSHLSTEDDDIFSKESGSIIADLAVVSTDVTECTSEDISPLLQPLDHILDVTISSIEGSTPYEESNNISTVIIVPATSGTEHATNVVDTDVDQLSSDDDAASIMSSNTSTDAILLSIDVTQNSDDTIKISTPHSFLDDATKSSKLYSADGLSLTGVKVNSHPEGLENTEIETTNAVPCREVSADEESGGLCAPLPSLSMSDEIIHSVEPTGPGESGISLLKNNDEQCMNLPPPDIRLTPTLSSTFSSNTSEPLTTVSTIPTLPETSVTGQSNQELDTLEEDHDNKEFENIKKRFDALRGGVRMDNRPLSESVEVIVSADIEDVNAKPLSARDRLKLRVARSQSARSPGRSNSASPRENPITRSQSLASPDRNLEPPAPPPTPDQNCGSDNNGGSLENKDEDVRHSLANRIAESKLLRDSLSPKASSQLELSFSSKHDSAETGVLEVRQTISMSRELRESIEDIPLVNTNNSSHGSLVSSRSNDEVAPLTSNAVSDSDSDSISDIEAKYISSDSDDDSASGRVASYSLEFSPDVSQAFRKSTSKSQDDDHEASDRVQENDTKAPIKRATPSGDGIRVDAKSRLQPVTHDAVDSPKPTVGTPPRRRTLSSNPIHNQAVKEIHTPPPFKERKKYKSPVPKQSDVNKTSSPKPPATHKQLGQAVAAGSRYSDTTSKHSTPTASPSTPTRKRIPLSRGTSIDNSSAIDTKTPVKLSSNTQPRHDHNRFVSKIPSFSSEVTTIVLLIENFSPLLTYLTCN